MGHLVDYEPIVRLASFAASLGIVAAVELIVPRRPADKNIRQRWFCNLILALINTLFIRICFTVLPVGMAVIMQGEQRGLFNNIHLPLFLECILTVLFLDFAIYLQHLAFHHIPLAWRLHKVHHTDMAMDVTTGIRFHPLEICISLIYKLLLVVLLGPPAVAVVIFEVLLNVTSIFSHANIALPIKFDRWLRLLLVTPDMHRVHHSVKRNETDSNFGFNLPWWDRIFGTYQDQPSAGHLDMPIGLAQYRNSGELTLGRLLLLPLRR